MQAFSCLQITVHLHFHRNCTCWFNYSSNQRTQLGSVIHPLANLFRGGEASSAMRRIYRGSLRLIHPEPSHLSTCNRTGQGGGWVLEYLPLQLAHSRPHMAL